MTSIKSYRDLLVWQKAIQISVEVYKITKMFPSEELFGLTNQIRRASNSISLNIAEGYGRHTTKSYVNYLVTSRATLYEVESGMFLAKELELTTESAIQKLKVLLEEESKMLASLIKSLTNKIH
ncbi:MAG: four helix bundle protein [Bacteroidota bacterium]